MLDQPSASEIVVNCIRAVSHVPTVDESGTLDDAGISDTARVTNMVTLIVNSKQIGVPSKKQRISASFFLGVDPSTPVFDVEDIVMDKSVEVSDAPMDEFAALVAKHLANHMAPSKKKATKKSTKKKSKAASRKRTK
jgi:hypothetical protein